MVVVTIPDDSSNNIACACSHILTVSVKMKGKYYNITLFEGLL